MTIEPPEDVDGSLLGPHWRDIFPTAERLLSCQYVVSTAPIASCGGGTGGGDPCAAHHLEQSGQRRQERLTQLDAGRTPRSDLTSAIPVWLPFETHSLPNADAVQDSDFEVACARGPIDTIVVGQPDGRRDSSELAPWVAARIGQLLVLTNDSRRRRRGCRQPGVDGPGPRAGGELTCSSPGPARSRPNAATTRSPARTRSSRWSRLTPEAGEPFTFATGRLFHADPGMVALILARQRLLPPDGSAAHGAWWPAIPATACRCSKRSPASAPANSSNRGYKTTALLGDSLSARQLRIRLPDADVFLWEGHHNTLIKDWGFVAWDEPLRPSLMFLQSCLALTEEKASPLFDRGAVAVVGSSSRIYSATGGAFSLAYLDGVLYDGPVARRSAAAGEELSARLQPAERQATRDHRPSSAGQTFGRRGRSRSGATRRCELPAPARADDRGRRIPLPGPRRHDHADGAANRGCGGVGQVPRAVPAERAAGRPGSPSRG